MWKKPQKALEDFRNKHRDLDPQATATGLQTIVLELEGERAKLRAEIEDAQSYNEAVGSPTEKSSEFVCQLWKNNFRQKKRDSLIKKGTKL